MEESLGYSREPVCGDRNSESEPRMVPKHSRRVEGLDESIISLYAKGLTTDEIQKHCFSGFSIGRRGTKSLIQNPM